MSEQQPASAPRRPGSARPRRDAHEPVASAPSRAELEAIERHHAELSMQAGAELQEDAELALTWVRAAGRGPALNYAACVRWPASQADERIESVARLMRGAGEWPVLKTAEGLTDPADLAERLHAAGWIRLGGERIMWTRHPATVPHLDPGLRIEAVTRSSAIDAVRLETQNFALPPDGSDERAERLARLIETGRVRAFLLRLVREPVASARLDSADGIAALSAIGVAARHRRRGYGSMITAVATRAGLATGHGLVWLSVEEDNVAAVELYRGLGFQPAFAWSRWAAPAGEGALPSAGRLG